MTIASEVQRIKTNIASAYDKCEEKGATMPDNENSANLADTIDSIPTGGGEGSGSYVSYNFRHFNETEYNSKVQLLNTLIADNYEDSREQGGQFRYIDGAEYFTTISGQSKESITDTTYFAVLQFAPYVTDVYSRFTNNDIIAYYAEDGVSISLDSSIYHISFTGSTHTIILCWKHSHFLYSYRDDFSAVSGSTSYINLVPPIAMYLKTSTSEEKLLSNATNISMDCQRFETLTRFWPYFERIQLPSNYKIDFSSFLVANANSSGASVSDWSTDVYPWAAILRFFKDDIYDRCIETKDSDGFIQLNPNWTNSAGVSLDTTIGPKFILGSTRYSSYKRDLFQTCAILGLSKVPVIIDLSSTSGTGTWYLNSNISNDFLEYSYVTITQVRLILPSSYSKVDLTSKGRSNSDLSQDASSRIYSPTFDLASWQYMAEHAPSVSGKTLVVGYEVYGLMERNSDFMAVKETFTSKGWTMSYYS